jgi:hypothetical protein
MPDELKKEITTYLTEVKADLENYLTWAMSEVSMGGDTAKAAEVVEDTIHRLMTIAYYPRTPIRPSSSPTWHQRSPKNMGRKRTSFPAGPPWRTRPTEPDIKVSIKYPGASIQ